LKIISLGNFTALPSFPPKGIALHFPFTQGLFMRSLVQIGIVVPEKKVKKVKCL
jgi:hypothetical protein